MILKNTMKIRKYFSIKDNENLAYSNLWDTATVSRVVKFLKYYMLLKAFRACGAVHTLLRKLHLRQN